MHTALLCLETRCFLRHRTVGDMLPPAFGLAVVHDHRVQLELAGDPEGKPPALYLPAIHYARDAEPAP